MIANAKRRDEPAGVVGNNVFVVVVVGDSITFVPTRELRGKTKESIVAIISDEVESFMSDISQIEGGIKTFLGFEGYDECVAGGGSVCHQVQAAHDNSGLE
ncbi:MAG: hypothetical protein ACPIEU_04495 [Candidatus Puniceispirillaceae bacterium]